MLGHYVHIFLALSGTNLVHQLRSQHGFPAFLSEQLDGVNAPPPLYGSGNAGGASLMVEHLCERLFFLVL